MRRRFLLSVLLLLGLALAASPSPQQRDEVRRALDRARRLERVNKYEEALRIHQRLFSSHPNNPQALDGVERDLLQLKRYSELIDFLQELLEAKPEDQSLLGRLGNALYKSGQKEEAEATWRLIIEQAPDDQASYGTVARQYLYNGAIDRAVATYLLGRKRLGKPSLFARDLARLHASQMEYGEATREYMRLLDEDPKQYSYVENMIGHFKRTDNTDDEVVEVLEDGVKEHPGDPQFRRLLGSHYLRMGEPERAYEQYVKVEEMERTNGGTLIDFADWSYREGFYSTALKAYRHLLALYPKSPLAPKAMQGIGRSLARLGRYREAISAFRSLASGYPTSKETENALFEIGVIQLQRLSEADSALSTFSHLVNVRKQGRHYFEAMFRIGDCYLVKADLSSAQQEYEQVRKQAGHARQIAEEAAFKIAEIKYFRGDFDGALKELEALTKAHPKGVYVNDALALMVFLEENRMTGDDALKAFARAALLERQKKPDEAIEAYERILTYYPYSFLGDDALLKIGAIRNRQSNFEASVETYLSLLAKYPTSDLCDEAQRRIGEVYEVGLQDIPKAIEAYEQILSKYPDSLLYDSVRKRIRELQVKLGAPG
ncbi:MAG: tetratricopeptide repeat protein [bacterium]